MIKPGDNFTHLELFQSTDEICSVNLGQYILTPLLFSPNGQDFIDLQTHNATQYAEFMISAYPTKSSANALDKQLKRRGYRTTYKFAYEYKMPQSMKARLTSDAYKLNYFLWVFTISTPDIVNKTDLEILQQYAIQAATLIQYYAQYICAYNPGIYDYQNKDWYANQNFIIGASFNFHPLDIKYHNQVYTKPLESDEIKIQEQTEFKNWCKQEFNIDTGCLVLSDEHRNKLTEILTTTKKSYFIQLLNKCFYRHL